MFCLLKDSQWTVSKVDKSRYKGTYTLLKLYGKLAEDLEIEFVNREQLYLKNGLEIGKEILIYILYPCMYYLHSKNNLKS